MNYLSSCINERDTNEQSKDTESSEINNKQDTRESRLRPADKMSQEFHDSLKVGTGNNGTPVYEYPSYFGGSYIDKDGNFVVVIVDGKEDEAKEDLVRKLKGKKYINQKGEYSYGHLDSINEMFKVFLNDKASKDFLYNFYSSYIDVYTNRYVIELKDINDKDVINEIMDFLGNPDGLEFIKGAGGLELTQRSIPPTSLVLSSY